MGHVLDELQWRGLVAQTTDEEALRVALSRPITAYCGFDPTAASLHVGNLVQIMVLRHLQRHGHRIVCLVGGATGLIGDPKPSAERVLKSREDTADHVERIKRQVQPFLAFDGDNPALLVDNRDWTEPVGVLDFLRDVGKHFRVNQMVKKDAVAARLASQEGISFTEFSYQLLQANDFLHLHRTYDCVLQTGGQDQWGNLTAGADLVHKVEGVSVHLLTTPLVTDSTGEKLGKSAGNAVWLDGAAMSSYAFYQWCLNVEDDLVVKLLRLFTERSQEEITALETTTRESPHARAGQRALADDLTALVHGRSAAEAVVAASAALFGGGDLRSLDAATLRDATAELPSGDVEAPVGVMDAAVASGLVDSRGAARRLISEGGLSLNNAKVTDIEQRLEPDDFLHGDVALLRRGKKTMAVVRRVASGAGDPSCG